MNPLSPKKTKCDFSLVTNSSRLEAALDFGEFHPIINSMSLSAKREAFQLLS